MDLIKSPRWSDSVVCVIWSCLEFKSISIMWKLYFPNASNTSFLGYCYEGEKMEPTVQWRLRAFIFREKRVDSELCTCQSSSV